jgi:NAD(P)-dependent dehydrogenase (short-subunit alcohol dehydrogenase family)
MSAPNTVALITGASKGIGASILSLFRSKGIISVGTARTKQDSCEIVMNVRNEDSVASTVNAIIGRYGHLDILVNNAGVVSQISITECTLEEWHEVMDTNLTGAFLCSKYALRHFLEHGGGVIINIASIAGKLYSATASEAYTCSKYGIIGLTKQLANRYANRNIRVNCVCPSQTLTPMLMNSLSPERIEELGRENPMGRLAFPEEVAEAVYFLASDKAAYINGAVLDINGGKL